MAHPETRMNELDSYIRQIEAKEKGKKKKLLLFAFLGLGALGLGGSVSFLLPTNQAQLRHFDGDGMTMYKIDSIFEKDNSPIVLIYGPGVPPDTIESPQEYFTSSDYYDVEPTVSLQEEPPLEVAEESKGEEKKKQNETIPVPKTKLQKFSFAIEGERTVNNSLKFTIVDYDENVNYTMDFGNGIRKRIYKRATYSYNTKGNFLINLVATNESNATSIYSRHITITEKPKKELIAQSESDTKSAQTSSEPGQTKSDNFEELVENSPSKAAVNKATESAEEPSKENKVEETPAAAKEEKKAEMTPKYTGPLISAEKMPSFPGGQSAMFKFLRKRLRYPHPAEMNGIEGKVYLQFIVRKNGQITDVKVLKGIGYGCDEEAVKAIKNMPKWIPGEQDGKKVDVYYTTRISFYLERGGIND